MSDMIKVVINDIDIEVKKGTTILDAATENGIEIPTLCYLVGVSDVGMCISVWWRWKVLKVCFLPAVQNVWTEW